MRGQAGACCPITITSPDHAVQERITSGSPYSTGWPFSTSIAFTVPSRSDSISFRSFIASMMHRVSPGLDRVADLRRKALAPGADGPVEGPDHRRADDVTFRLRGFLLGRRGGGSRGGGSGRGRRGRDGVHLRGRDVRRRRADAADANLFLALGDFQLGDSRLLDEVDQRLQLAQIHRHRFRSPVCCSANSRASS